MIEIKSPTPIPQDGQTLFLAGSIEMGTAEDWQQRVKELLADSPYILLNPRRETWDPSSEQHVDNPVFREQVEWELAAQEKTEKILMYFAPGTKAPISLLEFGLFGRANKLMVVCPEGFWRKGNVDIVCKRYGIRQFDSLEAACAALIAEART